MTEIRVEDVSVEYQVHSRDSMNLKRRLVRGLIGQFAEPRRVAALNGFSYSFCVGDRTAIIGHNGAGKSTLLRVLAGVLHPTKGSIQISGKVASFLGDSSTSLDPEATGEENCRQLLAMQLGHFRISQKRVDRIVEFSRLGDRFYDPVFTYSTGMAARLRLSILLESSPDILILDEGIASVDANFDAHAMGRIYDFLNAPKIVICATHSMDFARSWCTSGLLFESGTCISSGEINFVVNRYREDMNFGDSESTQTAFHPT